MSRVVTFGKMPTTMPKGNFREVFFPQLALLDEGTGEGFISRFLHSDGGNTRDLPRTISFQYMDTFGHDNAAAVGSLWEVTIDGETGIMSGRGFLADTPDGHLAELAAVSKALHHNSVDLADIPYNGVRIVEHGDWWDDDWHAEVHFDIWSLGKTTLVALPAFRNARMEVIDDDIAAALGLDEPLVIDIPSDVEGHTPLEVAAALTVEGLPKYDYFHMPEADIPHKIMVDEPDEHGWCRVYGHLARWGKPHTGLAGRNVYAMRSPDNYARFCQPSVLTDKGLVPTGPITLYDGHRPIKACADDPATAWADVRVVDGRFGPWVCGVARPHITHEMAERYVARASRISGHWEYEGGPLRMIVSVNAEGYPIDRVDDGSIAASFSFDEEVAAGMTPVMMPNELLHFADLTPEAQAKAKAWIGQLNGFTSESPTTMSVGETTTTVTTTETVIELNITDAPADDEDDFDPELAELHRQRMLALEAEAEAGVDL